MGALNIKDAIVAEKARKLARLTGKTITDAVSAALDESLRVATHKSAIDRERREREVDEIVARFQAKISAGCAVLERSHGQYVRRRRPAD